MRDLTAQAELLAASGETTVLIVGEVGTGKRRVAEYVHAWGPRASCPFVRIACSALAAPALEAELLGRARAEDRGGAGRGGGFAAAEGGTLFLDEVAALDEGAQRGVLRALEERGARRAGDGDRGAGGVRLMAATTRDLVSAVTDGAFREDLYYQLSVMPIHLPPLRARAREDVAALVAGVTEELASEIAGAPRTVDGGALDRLVRHSWPGNVRELRNVLERALLAARGEDAVRAKHLPYELRGAGEGDGSGGAERHLPQTLAEVERAHIERTLRAHRANRTHAARELGISRATLIKKIKEYGLP